MRLFTVFKKTKPKLHKGKDATHVMKKQHKKTPRTKHGWLLQKKAMTMDLPNILMKEILECASTIFILASYKGTTMELKTGASPTLHLTQFSIQDDNYNEERSLSRIFDCMEDM